MVSVVYVYLPFSNTLASLISLQLGRMSQHNFSLFKVAAINKKLSLFALARWLLARLARWFLARLYTWFLARLARWLISWLCWQPLAALNSWPLAMLPTRFLAKLARWLLYQLAR